MNALLALFSRDASGLLVAALVAVLAIALRPLGLPTAMMVAVGIVALALALASVRHLVVLTRLETTWSGPRLGGLTDMRRTAWLGGFAQLFGIDLLAQHEARQRRTPAYAKALDATRAVLGPKVNAERAVDARSGAFFTQ